MIALQEINSEVFVAQEPIVVIGQEETSFLKCKALQNIRRRARICAHQTSDEPLHEMLIAIARDSYIHPHKHVNKSESFHIIEGLVDVIIFDDKGKIKRIISLGEQGSRRACFYRLSESMFHTLIVHSEVIVIHEVTNGPFDKKQTIEAEFAPFFSDRDAVNRYRESLSLEAENFARNKPL